MRLSIEITPEQHQLLKVAAALQGESIKNYVLKRALPDIDENEALAHLESFLKPRVTAAKEGKFSNKTVSEIFKTVLDGTK